MTNKAQESAIRTLKLEVQQIENLLTTLNDEVFSTVIELLASCKGKVICMGVGKSGHIARKISASLASTGTSSFYVHPCEAGHGDAGMIDGNDIVLYISNSGESLEFNTLYSYFKRRGTPIVAITNNPHSTLAQKADYCLLLRVAEEACPLKLAPTASTTNTLVLGDCITVALIEHRGFTKDQFAISHPFGALGRRLLLKNSDLMKPLGELPLIDSKASIGEALLPLSAKNLGCVLIVDSLTKSSPKVLGIFTDGDLRRLVTKKVDLYTTSLASIMTKNFTSVHADELAFDSLKLMEQKKITALPVLNSAGELKGLVHFHDLILAGI